MGRQSEAPSAMPRIAERKLRWCGRGKLPRTFTPPMRKLLLWGGYHGPQGRFEHNGSNVALVRSGGDLVGFSWERALELLWRRERKKLDLAAPVFPCFAEEGIPLEETVDDEQWN